MLPTLQIRLQTCCWHQRSCNPIETNRPSEKVTYYKKKHGMTDFESPSAFSYGPKTSLGSTAAGPAGQLLLDAASSWESERAKKTTEEEAAAAAARPVNLHHHHQLLLLNGTDEKKWLQQQGNHSNVHHHSQQQHLSPSRSNSCHPQSGPQKPIPSIRLLI